MNSEAPVTKIISADFPPSEIPIIFFHRVKPDQGKFVIPDYLIASLIQARLFNPCAPIHLLSNEQLEIPFDLSTWFDKPIEIHQYDAYADDAKRFASLYFHISINSYDIELSCFDRWFVVRDFVVSKGYKEFLYLDSDVLLFSTAQQIKDCYGACDYACIPCSWGTVLINNVRALQIYCDLNMELFTKSTDLWRWAQHRLGLHTPFGHVDNLTDMFTVGLFQDKYPEYKAVDMATPTNGCVFDRNIHLCEPDWVGTEKGLKYIEWHGLHPYGIDKKSGGKVRFHALHFQGAAKYECVRVFNQFIRMIHHPEEFKNTGTFSSDGGVVQQWGL